MLGLRDKSEKLPRIEEFYRDKSILITGATGFIGTVILESLLRCCHGIKCIYILVRSKKNVPPELRSEKIFQKKIFDKLRGENKDVFQKVYVVSGDLSLPNLGISEEDAHMLTDEVSIVFHCAASIHFKSTLKNALLNNVLSVEGIIDLCRKIKKFEALIYTSTAYSNYNYNNRCLKEKVYRLPFQATEFLDALKNGDDEELQDLFSHCKPEWPNTYTFSKCLAENLIMDTASDIPIVIIRPSAVTSIWKHPMPGYIENNSVLAAGINGIGRGFLRVMYADPNIKCNFIPADIVANAHIIAACSIGNKRRQPPMIVNCIADENFNISVSKFCETIAQITRNFPIPQSFMEPTSCIILPYKYLYYIVTAYNHYLPATVLDGALRILGKKPRFYSFFQFFDKSLNSASYFLLKSNTFENKNMKKLDKLIHSKDRVNLALDFSEANFLDVISKISEAASFYDWKVDEKSPSERKKSNYWCHVLVNSIQGMFIIILNLLLYLVYCYTVQ